MSSKLVPDEDQGKVEPMLWRAAGTGSAAEEFPQAIPGFSGSDWERRAEQRLREAHAAGVREGEAAGHRRALAELHPVMERLSRSIEEISSLRSRLRHEAEGDLVKLALAIARRILARELAIDPDALHGLVLGALEKLRSQEICRVRVHPAQEAMVLACLRQGIPSQTIPVIADPSSDPGAVVFETDRGNLDASVESQLQEIERGLTDRLRRYA